MQTILEEFDSPCLWFDLQTPDQLVQFNCLFSSTLPKLAPSFTTKHMSIFSFSTPYVFKSLILAQYFCNDLEEQMFAYLSPSLMELTYMFCGCFQSHWSK